MYNLLDTTFLFPVRLVDNYRKSNLFITLTYLTSFLNTYIYIGESDTQKKVPQVISELMARHKTIKYFFLKEDTPNTLFHRARILNFLAKQATTPIIAECDIDLIANKESYIKIRNDIISGKYEYTTGYKKINTVSNAESKFLLRHFDPYQLKVNGEMPSALGAITWCLRDKFFEYGGENEYCIGWGMEDVERHHRFCKLGIKASLPADGILWHMEHPPQPNRAETDRKNAEHFHLLTTETVEQTKKRIQETFYWLK